MRKLKNVLDQLTHLDVERLGDFLRSFGIFAVAVAVAATFFQACFPFAPFFVVAGANVLVFGLWPGMSITYSMTVLGAFGAFYFARYTGRRWVQLRLKRYAGAEKLNRKLAENGFFYVLMARLAFVIPSVAVNWISGLSKMKFSRFATATLLGKLPVVVLESMVGHDLIHFGENKPRLIALALIFLGFMLVGRMIQKKLAIKS